MPTNLQYLRDEVGLAGNSWESLGLEWCSLVTLWLWTKTFLLKAARANLTLTKIHKSNIPQAWKDWMSCKIMKVDATWPMFTHYLKGLPASVCKSGGMVMEQEWCWSGKTGVIGLLLCLFWQAEYSGVRPEWNHNIKTVQSILNAIISDPVL